MIRISYKKFRGGFLPAFEKLMNQPGLNQKVAYNLSKLAPKIKQAAASAQLEFIGLVEKWALRDEQGKFVSPKGNGSYDIAPEKEAEWAEVVSQFEQKEIMLDRPPLMVGDLAQATLTPNDYLALEPILCEMGLVETLDESPELEGS